MAANAATAAAAATNAATAAAAATNAATAANPAATKLAQNRLAIQTHQTRFMRDYNEHNNTILAMPSGNHRVNPERLEEWIESQQSQTRRDVARALSEHIVYIRHREVIARCRDLVNQFYTQYLPAQGLENPTIVLFTHRRGKSGYMIALLFYYWAKRLRFRVPALMVNELYPHLIRDPNCVFAYVDDMSYSGSQLSQILASYAIIPSYFERIPYPKFWIGFVAMTQHAQEHLTTIAPFRESHISRNQVKNIVDRNPNIAPQNIRPVQNRIRGIEHIEIRIPFTVYASRVIPSLRAQLGDEMFVAAHLFFNSEPADCIVYFDHKVADSPSTFMKVLVFGPVPAVDAIYAADKFGKKNEAEDDSYNFWSPDVALRDVRIYDRGKNGTSHVTQFKPFIDGCNVLDDATKEAWGRVPYAEFLSGDRYTDGPWPVPLNSFDNVDIRCPRSWYKTMFVGGKRKNKTRRYKKSNRKTRRR
jgi:hypothetical protein